MFEIFNNSELDLGPLEGLMQEFMPFAQERHGFQRPPKLFLLGDEENAANPLGKTGGYNPDSMEVTIYVSGRHPKDILRSFSHELVHHNQNERGDLSDVLSTVLGYAQDDPHMRDMEREAYEQGNLCFRDWEDGRKKQLQESIYYETIIGGNDMSEKKPLKEWKDNEINTRLMEKFGLTKEGADSGEADSITIHDETTAEKRSGDEESDEEEDEEESISGLGRNSTNETLSRLNEEVSHLLKEDLARRWLPNWMGGESSGGLIQSPEGPHIVTRDPAETRRGARALSTSRPIQPGSWELPPNVTGADVSKALDPALNLRRINTPMRTHGRFGGPEVRGDVFGTNPMEDAARIADARMYGPDPDQVDTISPSPYYDRFRQTDSGGQERAAVDRYMAQQPGGAQTKQMSAEEQLGWDAFLAADLTGGTHSLGALHTGTNLARMGRRMRGRGRPLTKELRRKVKKRYRPTSIKRHRADLENMRGSNDMDTVWSRPDNKRPVAPYTDLHPSQVKSQVKKKPAFDYDDWFTKQAAPDYSEVGPQSGLKWGHDPSQNFYGFTTGELAKWEAYLFRPRGAKSVNELADLAQAGSRAAIKELDVLGAELFQAWRINTPLHGVNKLNPANLAGIGSTRGYVPKSGRLELAPRIQSGKGLTALGLGAGAGYSWLNPEHIADLGSDDMVRPNPFPLGHGVGLPDPRSDLAAWTKPWYPIRPGYSRDPLDPNEQPKKYIVWNAKAGKIIAKRDVGKPPFKKERWDGWNKDPDIQIISNPAAAAKKAGVTLTAPKKRDDLSERAPYIWEELNESLDLDENFYDTLFEGVEDMWAKETKE